MTLTPMKTSAAGIHAIELREGIRLTVYLDTKKIPTVGVGHVVLPEDGLKVGDMITHEQCDAFLAKDIVIVEGPLNAAITTPHVTQNQFDALVSLGFNIGAARCARSTAVRRLNEGDIQGAAAAILMWNEPDEIRGRRRTEEKQFLTP